MRNTKITMCLVVMCVTAAANFASADTIQGINIDFVNIGNAGNVGDTRTGTDQYGLPLVNPYGSGAVGYNYRIGKYEVTNAQWNTFTAAVGAPTGSPSDAYVIGSLFTGAQQPTNNISWYEAAQFCNYLTSGNKSLGAYQLGADGSITVDRTAAISTYGTTYVIPTEDEWYKAAYFKPNGGYSLYANGTSITPIAGVNTNYQNEEMGQPWNIGTGTQEQNGTFDMMGNVWEWNENLAYSTNLGFRGGSYTNNYVPTLGSSYWVYSYPGSEYHNVGFRVASVPEPCSLVLLSLGGLYLRKRKK